ncbi:uncharacterized protein [Coffea arabica]|uniref:Reverse transcriptase RNase H-like domain-containing protein n=1 Tax=Coffea arabica TaxID=13443 RepID=A0ABM4VUA7_COFAR
MGQTIYEKKLLALVIAVIKWRSYLKGHHFIIKTDYQRLKYLLEQRITTPLQQRWLTKLFGLSCEMQYRKEKENVAADALSSNASKEEGDCSKLVSFVLDGVVRFKRRVMMGTSGGITRKCKDEYMAYPELLQPLPTHQYSWSHVTMDFIEGLPTSEKRDTIVVVVDRFTKFAHFISLTHLFNAPTVARTFSLTYCMG